MGDARSVRICRKCLTDNVLRYGTCVAIASSTGVTGRTNGKSYGRKLMRLRRSDRWLTLVSNICNIRDTLAPRSRRGSRGSRMSRPAALLAVPEAARRDLPLLSVYPPAGIQDEAEAAPGHPPETGDGKLVLTDELSA